MSYLNTFETPGEVCHPEPVKNLFIACLEGSRYVPMSGNADAKMRLRFANTGPFLYQHAKRQ